MGSVASHFAKDDALLIAAGQGLDRRVGVWRPNAKPRDPIARQLAPTTGRDEPDRVGQSVKNGDRDIIGDRLLEIEAERQSIFGNVGNASSHCVLVRAKIERRSIEQDFAALERRHPEKRQGEFGSARSQEPDHAEDLASAKHEGNVLELACARSASNFERWARIAQRREP